MTKKPTNADGFALVIETLKAKHPDRGPQAALAEACIDPKTGRPISRQAVNKWKEVPIRFIKDVERLTGLKRKQILPDVYA